MVKIRRLLPIILVLGLVPISMSHAITITATPNPVAVGQNVTFTVKANWAVTGIAGCLLQINFGDGNWIDIFPDCSCNLCMSCERTVTRSFTKPGTYLIQAQPRNNCVPFPNLPNLATITLSVINPISCPTPSALPNATPNVPYNYSLIASGGLPPLTYRVVGNTRLPHGLALSPSGIISGIPVESGQFNFVVKIKDAAQEVDCRYSIAVNPTLFCPPKALPSGIGGQSYGHQLVAQGNSPPFTYQLVPGNRLPGGLILSSSGFISGNPSETGQFQFQVKITDRLGQFIQCTFTLTINLAPLTVQETPKTFNLRRDRPATLNAAYFFKSNAAVNTKLSSEKGLFVAGEPGSTGSARSSRGLSSIGGQMLGEVIQRKEVALAGGNGQIVESIPVPVEVIRKASELGFLRFSYVRTWTSALTHPVTSTISFSADTDAMAALQITAIRLYFENQRPKITVKRNRGKLKAFADLRVIGRGILDCQFEVDGKFFSRVVRHIDNAREQTLTVETADAIPLRTFDEGEHVVKLVIHQPRMRIEFPVAVYYVTAETAFSIILLGPEDNVEGDISTARFKWSQPKSGLSYRIEFSSESEGKPFFSAETTTGEYGIPPLVHKNIFSGKQEIFWRVRVYDKEGKALGESEEHRFISLNAPSLQSSHIPGQVIILLKAESDFRKFLESLGARNGLQLIEVHDLASLGLTLAVFHTEKEIFPVIDSLKREPDLILAQPNHIFRTMAEPLCHTQNIYKALHLERIHTLFRGRGVPVAVVDSGADLAHQDLKDRIILHENLVPSPYRGEIHGTAAASLVAASLNDFGIAGVAPEASLLILRACRQVSEDAPESECYTTSISRALDIAIQKKAKVVNMSVGSSESDVLVSKLLDKGMERGILFVAPAGNKQSQKELVFPASHPGVLAVGGIDDKGNPYPNSKIARLARVCAPATNVMAAVPSQTHRLLSGTSMASATIAGLLAAACEKNRDIIIGNLPLYQENLCKWQEDLFKIKICEQ